MKLKLFFLLGTIITLNVLTIAQISGNKALPFSKASIHLEQNATDGDVELVLEIIADEEGLVYLSVVSPNGKKIMEFESPDKEIMGIRQFRFESPEPKNVASLKSAYPEGYYTFTGETTSGKKLSSKSILSHNLPNTVTIIQPKPNSKDFNTSNLKIAWTTVRDAASYILYVENDDFEFNITLPGSKTMITLPSGYLQPGTKYMLGIGTVSKNGNTSFVETSLMTGKN
ncbi:MAG TPA: hypothetical protein VKA26_00270 [Ignavibacteriaceae bacterium]|nr:hypothetical protein [Ignavibacteriaceae bacterium]